MKVRKGDTVVVIAGKDKGAKGKVIQAYPDTGRRVFHLLRATSCMSSKRSRMSTSRRRTACGAPVPSTRSEVLAPVPCDGVPPGRHQTGVGPAGAALGPGRQHLPFAHDPVFRCFGLLKLVPELQLLEVWVILIPWRRVALLKLQPQHLQAS